MSAGEESQETKEPRDLFHRGIVTKLFPNNNMGLVRTESGREVPFSFDLVILSGDVQKPGDLKEGMEVGYDIGWTGKGLRITRLKVFANSSSLKGERGQGEDLSSKDLPDKDA